MNEANCSFDERELVVIEMCLRMVQKELEMENTRFELEQYSFPWQHKKDRKRQNDFTIMEIGEMLKKVVEYRSEAKKRKIDLLTTATEIAERLSEAGTDNVSDSSGHFVIKEFEDGSERTVDVHKSTGGGTENPHYAVYCSFEDDDHDFYYTEDLSIKALHKTLKEIAAVEVQ